MHGTRGGEKKHQNADRPHKHAAQFDITPLSSFFAFLSLFCLALAPFPEGMSKKVLGLTRKSCMCRYRRARQLTDTFARGRTHLTQQIHYRQVGKSVLSSDCLSGLCELIYQNKSMSYDNFAVALSTFQIESRGKNFDCKGQRVHEPLQWYVCTDLNHLIPSVSSHTITFIVCVKSVAGTGMRMCRPNAPANNLPTRGPCFCNQSLSTSLPALQHRLPMLWHRHCSHRHPCRYIPRCHAVPSASLPRQGLRPWLWLPPSRHVRPCPHPLPCFCRRLNHFPSRDAPSSCPSFSPTRQQCPQPLDQLSELFITRSATTFCCNIHSTDRTTLNSLKHNTNSLEFRLAHTESATQ
jgi:hypothetical protein